MQKIKIFILSIILMLLIIGGLFVPKGRIEGKVKDKDDKPIHGAKVKTEPLEGQADVTEVKTNEEGKYTTDKMDNGLYLLIVSKDGYTQKQKNATMRSTLFSGFNCSSRNIDLDIVLQAEDEIEGEKELVIIAIYNSPANIPRGFAWDDTYLWSCDDYTNKIYKHNMDESLSIIATYDSPGGRPRGLTWDGTNLWSCDTSTTANKIYKHNMDVTLSTAAIYYSPGNNTFGLAWDGTNIWSCDCGLAKISKHNMDDATLSVAVTYNSPNSIPSGLGWDGTNIWSCDSSSDIIYKHNMDTTLSVAEEYDCPNLGPNGVTWAGENLWICDSYTDKIYKCKIE